MPLPPHRVGDGEGLRQSPELAQTASGRNKGPLEGDCHTRRWPRGGQSGRCTGGRSETRQCAGAREVGGSPARQDGAPLEAASAQAVGDGLAQVTSSDQPSQGGKSIQADRILAAKTLSLEMSGGQSVARVGQGECWEQVWAGAGAPVGSWELAQGPPEALESILGLRKKGVQASRPVARTGQAC